MRVLLVDDEPDVRELSRIALEESGFEVEEADNTRTALEKLATQQYDVLITDLHLPSAGDGLTLVSATRHLNPNAITLILSGFPEMNRAAAALLEQADGVLVKPLRVRNLVDIIDGARKKHTSSPISLPMKVAVYALLEQESPSTIADWLCRVAEEPLVFSVSLAKDLRSAHLPQLFRELVARLRTPRALGTRAGVSSSAIAHGQLRRQQGYTASMMVEESRMLQVSIFQTLQNNLERVNFSKVLESVMVIADEVDSQLAQAMTGYVTESKADAQPA